jgi:hypothetical protein
VRLYTVIKACGMRSSRRVAGTATSMLFRAWCAGCGAEYTYLFRVVIANGQQAA